jgi:hypothetical protein
MAVTRHLEELFGVRLWGIIAWVITTAASCQSLPHL